MPENKNSFIKSKMNKDLDERLLPSNEYRDASNVAVSRSEGSDVGALEAILGNNAILNARTGYANQKIIGYFVDEANGFIYYFLTDFNGGLDEDATSSNICTINQFNINTNSNTVLVIGHFLNLSKKYPIYGINLVENLLFWTDNKNQPRKINIETAAGNQSYYTSEDQISVCKFAPYLPLDFINLRSPATIKPSTLSKAELGDTVNIAGVDISTSNLNVSTYSDGSLITEAQTQAQWDAADASSSGAWCWFNETTQLYGKLYNKHAVNNTKGLAPAGFKVVSELEWVAIKSITDAGTKLKTLKPWMPLANQNGTNELGFNGRPAGYRSNTGDAALVGGDVPITSITTPTTTANNGTYTGTVGTTANFVTSGSGEGGILKVTVTLGVASVYVELANTGYGYDPGDTITVGSAVIGGGTNLVITLSSTDVTNFVGQLDKAQYWTSSLTDDNYYELNSNSTTAINKALTQVPVAASVPNKTKKPGRSVRIVKDTNYQGWSGDPEFLTDKFARFSYRFKYDDNEYSVIAPFSQDAFIPQQDGKFLTGDEDAAFRTTVVEFMQNKINNAVLNITLPSEDIITDYKVKEIDIIFKESDGLAYQVLETIDVDAQFISDLNKTNIFQYSYESTIPFKTLPQKETTRVYDKVPVRSIAQESSANRIIYGNFIQGNTAPLGLDYYISTTEKSTQDYTEYQNQSIKQNRNYQVGIVLADKYGRETDIVLSNYDGILDSSGNPQPGSNVFNSYKNTAFTSSIDLWKGDNLQLEFNNVIPENENANGISGFPGAYAKGNYYITTERPDALTDSYWNNNSTAELTSTAAQTVFDFDVDAVTGDNGLLRTDAGSPNTLNVYVNSGTGWILKTLDTDYTILGSGTYLQITFLSGLSEGSIARAEILFNGTDYKYTINNLFEDFQNKYVGVFGTTADGKYLRGLYTDYVKIANVGDLDTSASQRKIIIKTKEDITTTYWKYPTPASVWERSNATYNIDPTGFYTYRVAIRQQQQEYYNVYLPGIIDGYPIVDNTDEQGETAFITLVSDNINKVPRDLQEVGPLDDQFNSNTAMWGRVTNIDGGDNQQYFPNINADKVQLIGTVTDVFPGIDVSDTDPPTTKEINQFSIFDIESKPNVAKIGTQTAIGLIEDFYEAPPAVSENYPANMTLAVYETEPVVSSLALYYESSTSQLISDLNYNIKNNTTEITGSNIEINANGFDESDLLATTITNDFFPTDKLGNVIGGLLVGTGTLTSSITTNATIATTSWANLEVGNSVVAGTVYTNGSGTGAWIGFVVDGGAITSVSVNIGGTGYKAGDTITITKLLLQGGAAGGIDAVITLVESDLNNTTAKLISVNSKYKDGLLNPTNRLSDFVLENGTNAGSYKINTATTFYAGENNSTANFFEFTIQFKQNNGTLVNQSFNTTLGNVDPIITNSGVISVANGTNVEIFNSITTATGLTGVNGSADICSRFLFPRQTGAGWSFTSLTLPSLTVVTTDLDSYFIITNQAAKNVSNPCDPAAATAYGLVVKSAPEQTLKAGEQYLLTFVLTDALGSTDTEVVTVNVT